MRKIALILVAMMFFTACKYNSSEQVTNSKDKAISFVKEYGENILRGCGIKADSLDQIIGVEAIPTEEIIATLKADLSEKNTKYREELKSAHWFQSNGYKASSFFHLANMYQEDMLITERYLYHIINTYNSTQKEYGYQVLYITPSGDIEAVYIDVDLNFVAQTKDKLIEECCYLYSYPNYLEMKEAELNAIVETTKEAGVSN